MDHHTYLIKQAAIKPIKRRFDALYKQNPHTAMQSPEATKLHYALFGGETPRMIPGGIRDTVNKLIPNANPSRLMGPANYASAQKTFAQGVKNRTPRSTMSSGAKDVLTANPKIDQMG